MTSASTPTVLIETLADLLEHLGGILPNRVRFRPAPGTATEADVLVLHEHERRLYERNQGWRIAMRRVIARHPLTPR
jgi:hypothetical protein